MPLPGKVTIPHDQRAGGIACLLTHSPIHSCSSGLDQVRSEPKGGVQPAIGIAFDLMNELDADADAEADGALFGRTREPS